MKLPLFLILSSMAAPPSSAGTPLPPPALMGCWVSTHSENHWDDGKVTPFNAACSRFFTPTRLHARCRAPDGGPVTTVVFGYTPLSPGTFSVHLLESDKQSYVSDYLRPHEFVIAPGRLTLTSYPRLPKNRAGRSMVKTVSRFAADKAQDRSAAECMPPPASAPG